MEQATIVAPPPDHAVPCVAMLIYYSALFFANMLTDLPTSAFLAILCGPAVAATLWCATHAAYGTSGPRPDDATAEVYVSLRESV